MTTVETYILDSTESHSRYYLGCNSCRSHVEVLVPKDREIQYLHGGLLVQDAFPDSEGFTPAYREQIIGIRSGYHICDKCWDETLGDDE